MMVIWRRCWRKGRYFLLKQSLKSHHKENSFCPTGPEYWVKGVMLIYLVSPLLRDFTKRLEHCPHLG